MAVVKCFLSLVRLSGKSDQVLSGSIEWGISIGRIYSPDYFFFSFSTIPFPLQECRLWFVLLGSVCLMRCLFSKCSVSCADNFKA